MNEVNNDICRGRKPVLDLLTKTPSRCSKLLIANNVRPPYLDEVIDAAKSAKVMFQIVAPEALDKISGGEKHQGVICRLTQVKPIELEEFLRSLNPSLTRDNQVSPSEGEMSRRDRGVEPQGEMSHREREVTSSALVVVLDHIEDPHNLGAIIRSAEAGGASGVVYAKRRSAIPNDTVIKTSAGASLRLPLIQAVNITRAIETLKKYNFWIVGLDEKSDSSIWNENLPERTALVIGAEGSGISRLVKENCDMVKKIPIYTEGAGSLNASVAAALGIFEWSRVYRKSENNV